MVALIVIVGILAILAAPAEDGGDTDARPSTFHDGEPGARALYLALERLGVPVDRRLSAYVDADSLRGPLVLMAPAEPPTPAELRALRAWVEAGGTLFYVARPGDPALDELGLALVSLAPDSLGAVRRAAWRGIDAVPVAHDAATVGARPIRGVRWAFAGRSAAFRRSGAYTLFATRGGDRVVSGFRLGRGRVVAWSDAGPLRNGVLRESGAALPFARTAALATARGDTLRFDEYHQGYRDGGSAVGATLRFLREEPAGHAALQLGLAGMLLLLAAGWRFGAPVPPPPARRRSPLEHVEALAGAYRQAGARATARRLLLAGLARRLGRPGPRDAREAGELLERLGTRLPVGREAAGTVRGEWAKGDRADLVALARDVDRLLSEVKRT